MKGDGNVGDQKLYTKQGTIPYKKASHTDKRFTMIGLLSLDGNPVMYVLIIQGKDPNLSFKTGIDVTINSDGNLKTLTSSSIITEKGNISLEDRCETTVGRTSQHRSDEMNQQQLHLTFLWTCSKLSTFLVSF